MSTEDTIECEVLLEEIYYALYCNIETVGRLIHGFTDTKRTQLSFLINSRKKEEGYLSSFDRFKDSDGILRLQDNVKMVEYLKVFIGYLKEDFNMRITR